MKISLSLVLKSLAKIFCLPLALTIITFLITPHINNNIWTLITEILFFNVLLALGFWFICFNDEEKKMVRRFRL